MSISQTMKEAIVRGDNRVIQRLRQDLLRCVESLPLDDTPAAKRAAARKHRLEHLDRLFRKKPHLALEPSAAHQRLALGSKVRIDAIRPVVDLCRNREDFDLHDYLSHYSAFPVRDRPGRRFKFLLLDAGLPNRPVMGVGTLSSAIRMLHARDDWVGWRRGRRRDSWQQRLAYVLDYSTCVGIPPYAWLTSAKLLAHLSVTSEIRQLYAHRYAGKITLRAGREVTDIALVVATGAFGSNSPCYKGIRLAGKPVFRFLGYSRGYSGIQIPDALYQALIRALHTPENNLRHFAQNGSNARLRNLRAIARILKINDERLVRSGQRRSVFAAETATNSRAYLRGEVSRLNYDVHGIRDVVAAWRSKWLRRRWFSERVRSRVQAFDPMRFSIAADADRNE